VANLSFFIELPFEFDIRSQNPEFGVITGYLLTGFHLSGTFGVFYRSYKWPPHLGSVQASQASPPGCFILLNMNVTQYVILSLLLFYYLLIFLVYSYSHVLM
jgi:hypothetical protein